MLTWTDNLYTLSRKRYCPWCGDGEFGSFFQRTTPADRLALVRALALLGDRVELHYHGLDAWRVDHYSELKREWRSGPSFNTLETLLTHIHRVSKRRRG